MKKVNLTALIAANALFLTTFVISIFQSGFTKLGVTSITIPDSGLFPAFLIYFFCSAVEFAVLFFGKRRGFLTGGFLIHIVKFICEFFYLVTCCGYAVTCLNYYLSDFTGSFYDQFWYGIMVLITFIIVSAEFVFRSAVYVIQLKKRDERYI